MWCVYYKGNVEFVGTYEECELYLETAEMDKYYDLLDEGWDEDAAMNKAHSSYYMKKCN
jgi:hypothetical protein